MTGGLLSLLLPILEILLDTLLDLGMEELRKPDTATIHAPDDKDRAISAEANAIIRETP